MRPPFDRTSCGCGECSAHCHVQPGPLAPGDFERIAAKMRLPLEVARGWFRASPGAVVRIDGVIRRIGTIVPKADQSGRCAFLDTSGRCTIHDVAPFGCRMFDGHMEQAEAHRRGVWYLREIEADPGYGRLRSTLEPAATYRPAHW